MRWLASLLLLAACGAPPPPPGSEVRMDVVRPAHAQDADPDVRHLSTEERRHRRLATALQGLVAAGRVVVARCTLADRDLLFSYAVLPEGRVVTSGEAVRVRLGDREAGELDRVLGPVTEPPGLTRGSRAYEIVGYRTIVPWSTVALEGPLDPFVQAQYGRIRSGYVVKCLAP